MTALKALIVDDDRDSRDLLRMLLENAGYQVDQAEDGAQALEQAKSTRPDVIISDVLMPVMDGMTLCQKIKTDAQLAQVPIVIYTAIFTSAEDRRLAFDLGASQYIAKPQKLDVLLGVIEQVVADARKGDAETSASVAENISQLDSRRQQHLAAKLTGTLARLDTYRQTLSTLMANLPGVAYRCRNDEFWTMEFLSEGALSLTGFSPDALIENNEISFAGLIYPEDKQRVWDTVQKAIQNDQPYQIEYRILKGNREQRWIWEQGRCVSRPANGPEILEGFITDVTENKQLRIERDLSEERLRLALEGANVGLWDWNINEGRIYYSSTWTTMLGASQTDFGTYFESWSDRIHPEDLPGAMAKFEECLGNPQQAYENVYRFRHDEGHYLWIMSHGQVTVDANGRPARFVGTHVDITSMHDTEELLHKSERKITQTLVQTIQAIGFTIEKRDPYTSGHQRRVADLAAAIAQKLGMDDDQVMGVKMGGELHDIGKISIPSEFLSRPSQLTDAEYQVIKTHSQAGGDILAKIEFPWPIRKMVLQHHERMDGSGYPEGLQGDEIIREARVIGVADVVEAMASTRPYRPGLGVDAALEEIENGKGILYDADVVDACLALFREEQYRLPEVS